MMANHNMFAKKLDFLKDRYSIKRSVIHQMKEYYHNYSMNKNSIGFNQSELLLCNSYKEFEWFDREYFRDVFIYSRKHAHDEIYLKLNIYSDYKISLSHKCASVYEKNLFRLSTISIYYETFKKTYEVHIGREDFNYLMNNTNLYDHTNELNNILNIYKYGYYLGYQSNNNKNYNNNKKITNEKNITDNENENKMNSPLYNSSELNYLFDDINNRYKYTVYDQNNVKKDFINIYKKNEIGNGIVHGIGHGTVHEISHTFNHNFDVQISHNYSNKNIITDDFNYTTVNNKPFENNLRGGDINRYYDNSSNENFEEIINNSEGLKSFFILFLSSLLIILVSFIGFFIFQRIKYLKTKTNKHND